MLPIHKDSHRKWTPNYEGSYVLRKALFGGYLIITTMYVEDFPLPVNSDSVKKILCLKKDDKKPAKSKTRKGYLGKN